MKKVYLINIHSFIDVITNSSTELFVVDKTKVHDSVKGVLDLLIEEHDFDSSSSIELFKDSRFKDDIVLPEGYNPDDCYVLDIDRYNYILRKIIKKLFNPIEID